MDAKSLLLSKTLWVNVVAMLAAAFGAHTWIADPANQGVVVATLMGVANIGLRVVTKQPIGSLVSVSLALMLPAIVACTQQQRYIACEADAFAQPLLLPLAAGVVPEAAPVDELLVHPGVVALCATYGAKPTAASPTP